MDSTLLIDFLNGIEAAHREIHRHTDRAISVISWMEVMAGAPSDGDERTYNFLRNFELIGLSPTIATEAVQIRRNTRLKLPDAVILATAHVEKRVLLTRNTRDFSPGRFVQIPYEV